MISASILSKIGKEEKYIRLNHYNSIKTWWARRPLRAMRGLILNAVEEISGKEFTISDNIIYDVNPASKSLKELSKKYNLGEFSLLDVFAGGGSIPFESARLGLKTFSSELNPIASLLQETIFDSFTVKDFPDILLEVGTEIINNVKFKTEWLYNLNGVPFYTIFWGKTMVCPNCKNVTSLSKLVYLAKKAKKEVKIDTTHLGKTFNCSCCKEEITYKDIKTYCKTHKLGSTPIAICYEESPGKRKYKIADDDLKKQIAAREEKVLLELRRLSYLIPSNDVITKHGVINPTLYDLKKPADFFNNSQLLCLLMVIEEIIVGYEKTKKQSNNAANQLVKALTSFIEFLVDWNSTGTMWIPQNEQTGRSLAGPGVGMKWDYIEINPFFRTGSTLSSKLKRICSTFKELSINNEIQILKGSSTDLPLPDESIDIVLTDPPYFDSIDYTALSEFFRPWFELLIQNTYDSKINLQNDIEKEAIAELNTLSKRSYNHYYELMRDVFIESKRVLKENGKLVFVYGHKTIEGWHVIADIIKDSGLFVTNLSALDMERSARPRGMVHQSLNGVIAFELSKKLDNWVPQNHTHSLQMVDDVHRPIYIAAISCSEYINSGSKHSFQDVYSGILKSASQGVDLSSLDYLSMIYLKFINNSVDISDEEVFLAREFGILNQQILNPLDKVILSDKLRNSYPLFYEIASVYREYSNTSLVKVNITEENLIKPVKLFFSMLGGDDLNTIKIRSFNSLKKTSRTILSKLQQATTFNEV